METFFELKDGRIYEEREYKKGREPWYIFLDKNYKQTSDLIKSIKKDLSINSCHSGLLQSANSFTIKDNYLLEFQHFDTETSFIKLYLWELAHAAIIASELIVAVNNTTNVIVTNDKEKWVNLINNLENFREILLKESPALGAAS